MSSASERNAQLATLLQELAAHFIRAEANTNPLITVTRVTLSAEGKHATIHFTTIPEAGETDALIFLKRHGSLFRDYLKRHSRLKRIPHCEFQIDAGERHRQHIDTLVQEIDDDASY